tara:strand:- start:3352 stop:5238 length:1887 start_codon:yes stop_codon:yes gene_type:complete
MPPGIPYIVGNEAAERFSYYGMRNILVVFMVGYLHLMGDRPGEPMTGPEANAKFHHFAGLVYLTPILGALLADVLLGKYYTIIWLSIVYCLGHLALAMMGQFGEVELLLMTGLWLITVGAGGIKPCVSAHVGDQFGQSNSHLLTKVFNYFYWSINFGAFLSSMLTPWLLKWHGPHWAFGVPGILMALATLVFWIGRWKFIHIPPRGMDALREIWGPEGKAAIGKLVVIYLFVTMFWMLFDQHSSSWVLQAQDLNLQFGIKWLPSQVQAINPILVLTFIPLFTFVLYPWIDNYFPLTPLRKIAIGLFITALSFVVIALVQEAVDAGARPSVGWQLLAFVLLTAGEVMVSIVALEFSYTQAPRAMKSFIMGIFFLSVSLGNFITEAVNHLIQVPNPIKVADTRFEADPDNFTKTEPVTIVLDGLDKEKGTEDDLTAIYEAAVRQDIQFASREVLDEAAARLEAEIPNNDWLSLSPEQGQALLEGLKDPWGEPLLYAMVTRAQSRVTSSGPDKKHKTEWDQGIRLEISIPDPPKEGGWLGGIESAFRPDVSWIDRRKQELGLANSVDTKSDEPTPTVSRSPFVGGLTLLEGAPYFWFFAIFMLVTAFAYLPVLRFYKPKEYLHEEDSGTAS